MSLIIVIEQDRSRAERVSLTLEAEGWIVEIFQNLEAARQRAASNSPDLVVVGEGPDAAAAVTAFASGSGGPGAVVIGNAIPGADGSVDSASSDEQIRLTVRRCLSTLSRAAVEQAAIKAASSGGQFTSEDIFGDMLAEVEEEVAGAAEPGPQSTSPSAPLPAQTPAASASRTPGPSLPSSRPEPSPPSTEARSQSSVDRRLEETLSGVLGTPKVRKRPSAAKA
ncbi:MAG: hypothetical protein K8J08_02215, partial [Thermoanaerobaculia bacterium]|nr:hypothetical protein [Thermoanaerobaculia bacterium]